MTVPIASYPNQPTKTTDFKKINFRRQPRQFNGSPDPNRLVTYLAVSGGHTGSSGFTNYNSGTSEVIGLALEQVWEDHPGAVVVNGNDNLGSYLVNGVDTRGESFSPHFFEQVNESGFGAKPLAYFHSGISGCIESGLVLSAEEFGRVNTLYTERHGHPMEQEVYMQVYKK